MKRFDFWLNIIHSVVYIAGLLGLITFFIWDIGRHEGWWTWRRCFVDHTLTCRDGRCVDNAPPVVMGPFIDHRYVSSIEPIKWMTCSGARAEAGAVKWSRE